MGASLGGGAYSRPLPEEDTFVGQVFAESARDCDKICDCLMGLVSRTGTLAICRIALLAVLACVGVGAQEYVNKQVQWNEVLNTAEGARNASFVAYGSGTRTLFAADVPLRPNGSYPRPQPAPAPNSLPGPSARRASPRQPSTRAPTTTS